MTTTEPRVNRIALKSFRESHGLSIRKLAQVSGVSFSQIAAIERGDYVPTLPTVRKLTEALAIPVAAVTAYEEEIA